MGILCEFCGESKKHREILQFGGRDFEITICKSCIAKYDEEQDLIAMHTEFCRSSAQIFNAHDLLPE